MAYSIYQNGAEIRVLPTIKPPPALPKLDAATYTVRYKETPDGQRYFYLSVHENLTPPDKVYGRVARLAKRFIRAFEEGRGNLGVLLYGLKGSGKTTTLQVISTEMRRLGYPTILVEEAFMGAEFNAFLGGISQLCLIVYEEFEKKFRYVAQESTPSFSLSPPQTAHSREQDSILELLQGTVPGKKMVVLTANKISGLSEFLLNRPGRIRYAIPHLGMSTQHIADYTREHLKDCTDHNVQDMVAIARTAEDFNFDLLEAIVQEVNRFGDSVYGAAELMISRVSPKKMRYIVELYKGDERLIHDRFSDISVKSGFFSRRFVLGRKPKDASTEPSSIEKFRPGIPLPQDEAVVFTAHDLKRESVIERTFEYERDGYLLRLLELDVPHNLANQLVDPENLTERERTYEELEAEHGFLEKAHDDSMVTVDLKSDKKERRQSRQSYYDNEF